MNPKYSYPTLPYLYSYGYQVLYITIAFIAVLLLYCILVSRRPGDLMCNAPPPISKEDWRRRHQQRVWTEVMGPCKHCGASHLHSQCRERHTLPPSFIPIGYCCPTASLLKSMGVRRSATPLDWSKSTLAMWEHVLRDGGRALEDPACVHCDDTGQASHSIYCDAGGFEGARC